MAADVAIQTWLSDILKAAARVSEFVDGLDYDAYLASTLHISAVERQLSIVGEAVIQIRKLDPVARSPTCSQWQASETF